MDKRNQEHNKTVKEKKRQLYKNCWKRWKTKKNAKKNL